jgi:hypothetical protein
MYIIADQAAVIGMFLGVELASGRDGTLPQASLGLYDAAVAGKTIYRINRIAVENV